MCSVQQCTDGQSSYGAPQKTVCRTWFESECNTTYVESPSGAHKPNTWCQKMPRKICAPDNCNMIQVCNTQISENFFRKIERPNLPSAGALVSRCFS